MPAEFSTHSQIETIANPYRYEPGSGVAIAITKKELLEAGRRINGLWSAFVDCGIDQVLRMAQLGGRIVEFEAPDASGVAWYQAKFARSGIDSRTVQPIDIFHFLKENSDGDEPPTKMTVATYNGQKSRYTQLVALETQEEAEQVTGHYFRFSAGELVLLSQTGKPGAFFPAPNRTEAQTVRISNGYPESTDLEVEIGFNGSPQSDYLLQYIGHDLIKTRSLRVADGFTGELELVGVGPDGIIREPVAFSLPRAVANIANFEPAIAV